MTWKFGFVAIPLCSTSQKSLWRLGKTVGWRWFGRLTAGLVAGNESGMNNAGHSTGSFLTEKLPLHSLTQVVIEYGFEVICPQLNINSWGQINLLFSA